MPRVKKKIIDSNKNDPYEKYDLKKIIESNLSKNELLEAIKDLIDLVKSESNDSTHFYPAAGTAFYDKSTSPTSLLIVEQKSDLSVISDPKQGFVAFFCSENGVGDFPNWVESVRDGSIEVVWCPVHGRIADNNDYIKKWNL
jgi:hypothetical protein